MNNLFTPINQEDEEIDPITGLPMSLSQPVQSVQPVPVEAAPAPQIDTREYLMKKYNLGPYGDEGRAAAQEQTQLDGGDRLSAALMALGAGFQGRDSAAAASSRLQQLQGQRNQALDQFEKGRSAKIQEFSLDRDLTKADREDRDDAASQALAAREKDPMSEESKMAQDLAKAMGYQADVSKLTAEQFKTFSPALQKKYEIAQRSLDRKESAAERASARAESRENRDFQRELSRNEKQQGLKTPYGPANTVEDAKSLKEAHESKQNFDNKINEMIELRKKYGAEAYNREAVARGKQLSKDLLLEYKNMAKLGVLSKSDEDIINAIIPADPLEFKMSSLVGQDPIMTQLTKFKQDSDKDFATRIATRTRSGLEDYSQGKKPQAAQGKIRVSNGRETLEIDSSDLADAEKDGYKRI